MDLASGGADAEPDPADPGGGPGRIGQFADELRQDGGGRLADIQHAERGAVSLRQLAAQLEKRLRDDGVVAHVVNAGASGDTTAGGLARLDWSLADKPDLVVLELGANDMLRGIEPAEVRANLDKMIEKIKASGAKLLLAGMQASPNWGETYQKQFDRIYPELAQAHGVALYPFFLEGVAMDPEFSQPDGLHPNARGVAVIVERIAPRVADLLGGRS